MNTQIKSLIALFGGDDLTQASAGLTTPTAEYASEMRARLRQEGALEEIQAYEFIHTDRQENILGNEV